MSEQAQTFALRLATADDLPLIVFQRRAMFEDMGNRDLVALDLMNERFASWMKGRIEKGEFRGWFVTDDRGTVLAGAGLWLQDSLPSPRDPSTQRAYVMNVYTAPEHRRQGHARRLMDAIMTYVRERGIRTVVLHASDAGRALYESLGFQQTNEMRIVLPRIK
ncbi:MAG TPA: GNAT family N-acetyltransferase [Anaerolineae bacterium]